MMWHSICEKVRYEDSKYRGMTRHRYPVASLVPPVASELHSMLDWWWIAAHHYHHYSMCGNQVQFPSLSCVTVLAINSFQFTARVTTYCLGTCFVFLRMETPLFRIVRFGAVCTLISRQRPPTIASGIFPIEAQASSCLSSTSHHLIFVSTSLLCNPQVTTEHLPLLRHLDIFHTPTPPFLNSLGSWKNKLVLFSRRRRVPAAKHNTSWCPKTLGVAFECMSYFLIFLGIEERGQVKK